MNPLSAGTGPAAAILVGGALVMVGQSIGWLLIGAGVFLSLRWSRRFR